MTNTLSKLAKMKLDVIKYHADTITTNKDNEEITNLKDLVSIARDACYTSHNSIQYTKSNISDTLAEYDRAVEEKNDHQKESSKRYLVTLKSRLETHQDRHQADLDVYANLTGGEVWKYTPKGSKVTKSSIPDKSVDELRSLVA